jgi:hypothetical protein
MEYFRQHAAIKKAGKLEEVYIKTQKVWGGTPVNLNNLHKIMALYRQKIKEVFDAMS